MLERFSQPGAEAVWTIALDRDAAADDGDRVQIDSPTETRLLRALVAEDDAGIRRLIAGLLRLDGWEVVEAEDGEEAVALARDFHPDALVMDVMMPKLDGLTATEEIREQEGNGDCAVIVVSAHPTAQDRAEAIGTDHFISKPFDPDELTAKTRAALRWHRSPSSGA